MDILEAIKKELNELNIHYMQDVSIWIPEYQNPALPTQSYIRISRVKNDSYFCTFRKLNSRSKFAIYEISEYHRLLSDILNFYYQNIETP